MKTYRSWIALALTMVVCAALAAGIADAREGGHIGHPGGHPWHGHSERGWPGPAVGAWHGGHWFHGDHLGRTGWWWIVGDGWYFYPAPVYPYPDPYVPPAVVAPSTGYWYYCPSAAAYYPSVTECPEAWRPVAPQSPAS